jgi:mannose-6-phosphate isomerase-like protein (cupin superfamily)
MKRFKISDMGAAGPEHVASKLLSGSYIQRGALSFHPRGWRTHAEGYHVHDDHEVFVIMQGQGEIEVDGRREPVHAGEVLIVEPGEEHYLIGDPEHPIINLWFHAGEERHPDQQ